MVKFGGWAGLSSPPANAAATLAAVVDKSASRRERADVWQDAMGAIAVAGDRVDTFRDAGALVVVAGRPIWRGASPADPGAGIAQRVLDEYRISGVDVLQSLHGAFALALVLDGGRRALLAIDRIGVGSLTWRAVGAGLVFGSSSDQINDLLQTQRAIDLQSLYNYVFLHIVPGPATIFRDEFRIPPGGYVEFKNGTVASGSYWQMRFDEQCNRNFDSLKSQFREILDRSVRSMIGDRVVGAFLSGGTDSSTIAGLLTKASGGPVRTYSIGFEAQGYDEMEYARIAARHFATSHHEYYVTPDDVLALAPRLAQFCDQPFGNASAVPTYYCAQLAKSDGVDLLLGGDGGDELFGGNERYAAQVMFTWYARVPNILRKALFEPALFGIPGAERLPLLRKGRNYVTQAAMSVPRRLHAYNMLRRMPLDAVFTDVFLAQIDPSTPLNLLEAAYEKAAANDPLNRILAMDMQFTLADNDLYKVNRMCDLAGVEVAYPMLDDDLVAFAARLPAKLKLKGTRLRYFFKEALKDLLPAQIIHKQKHGFGLPIGIWMESHEPLKQLVYDAVHALGTRGVVRGDFVDRIIAEHRAGHAAYWGGEIWVLSQLELWLQAHGWPAGKKLA